MNKIISENAQRFIQKFNQTCQIVATYESIFLIESLFSFLSAKEQKEVIFYENTFKYNLLMNALDSKNEALAKWCIDKGMDCNHVNHQGMSALYLAIDKGLSTSALIMIDTHPDLEQARLNRYGKRIGDTALICAAAHGNIEVLNKLIQAGADPFYLNEFSRHALFFCTKKGERYVECFDKLISLLGMRTEHLDMTGFSVLECVLSYGSKEHLNVLAHHHMTFDAITKRIKAKNSDNQINNQYLTVQEQKALQEYWFELQPNIFLNRTLTKKESIKKIEKRHKI